MDLQDRSRRNNLRILGIKEDPQKSWEECENKIYDLLEETFQVNTSNKNIERKDRVGEKSNDKERTIVVQFSFYKYKINVLRNCKKLKETKNSIFEDFSKETMQIRKEKWKEVLAIRKKVRFRTCSIKVLFTRKGENPRFDPFGFGNVLLNNTNAPDENIFHNLSQIDSVSYAVEGATTSLKKFNDKTYSVLHLNAKSFNQNFKSLKELLTTIKFGFKAICLTEIWCTDDPGN